MDQFRSACVVSLVFVLAACVDFGGYEVVRPDANDGDGNTSDGTVTDGDVNDGDATDDATLDADDGDAEMDASVDDAMMSEECTLDDHCEDNEFCSGAHVCEARRANALDCSAATQCLSGFCDPDGICCTPGGDCCDTDAECAGQYRCDTGARRCFATCTSGTELTACKDTGYCSAAGNCVADLGVGAGNACDRNTMCAGNANCVDGYCCNSGCTGCNVCNKPGSLGVCALANAGTDLHNTCTASGCTNDGTCNGSGGCRVVANNSDPNNACTASGCGNDGMCNGSGSCRLVAAGTDPNNACDGECLTGTCNGSGACSNKTNQTSCGGSDLCGGNQCLNGVCTDYCSSVGAAACTRCNFVWACTGGCTP